ncbi:hypothetical protein F3Y22_tig00110556pilonHSYRG00005 [Hibiscus syriacus]|uniref:Uncharacterized protein n=1 Tax=Hibiscus syriacus TaxID=106335 RepID=A0A6A3A9N6_HIBSY|nr:hypothetical protein F3Y22_tig00110556pilonHSYRG00005 [Hibiscus syriacus]
MMDNGKGVVAMGDEMAIVVVVFVGIKEAFVSVPHLYESFSWWRRAGYLKVHFAESWNEMHHLLIMEVRNWGGILGGLNAFLITYARIIQKASFICTNELVKKMVSRKPIDDLKQL